VLNSKDDTTKQSSWLHYIVTKEEMPRVPRFQRNRSNIPADTPLLYYKRSTGIPFIDILL